MILDGEAVVEARSVGTRLGRGLGADGNLDSAARERTLATIRDYAVMLRARAATIDAIATSALRRANDAAAFAAAVETIVGVLPRIISGDEEAAYSFAGATFGAGAVGRTGVLDVGGGSTELAVGIPPVVERTMSLEIGAVRLSERHPLLMGERALEPAERRAEIARARATVDPILAPLGTFEPFERLLAVGGTVFTAAAMIARDPLRDGVRIDAAARREIIDGLLARDLSERREMPYIRPQRADILPAGLIIVDAACAGLGIDALNVSHADLLAGYLRSAQYRAAPMPADSTP